MLTISKPCAAESQAYQVEGFAWLSRLARWGFRGITAYIADDQSFRLSAFSRQIGMDNLGASAVRNLHQYAGWRLGSIGI